MATNNNQVVTTNFPSTTNLAGFTNQQDFLVTPQDNPTIPSPDNTTATGTISQDGLFFSNDNDPDGIFVWEDFQLNNYYYNSQHTFSAGITSPSGFQGKSVAFFRLAAPTLIWVCDWTACKTNDVPQVPDPYNPLDTNWVLEDIKLEPMISKANPNDGISVSYRINGTYTFSHKNPAAKAFSNIRFGRQPWIQDTFTRTVSLTKLTRSLMDSSFSTTGSSNSPSTQPNFTASNPSNDPPFIAGF